MQTLDNHHLGPELLSCLATLMCDAGDADTAARLVGASHAAFEMQHRVGLTQTLVGAVDLVRLGSAPAP